jgi:hypothetical protein
VFRERYREFRKFVVSWRSGLSLFGIGLALLSLEMYFIPKVFKSFRLSLLKEKKHIDFFFGSYKIQAIEIAGQSGEIGMLLSSMLISKLSLYHSKFQTNPLIKSQLSNFY